MCKVTIVDAQKDIEYFRTKVEMATDPRDIDRYGKQLALLEDALVVYRLQCLREEFDKEMTS